MYSENVARRVFQFVAGLILIFSSLTPLINCFDTWDKRQPPVNDTELRATALVVFAGFLVVLPKLVRRFLIGAVTLPRASAPERLAAALSCSNWVRPEPSASPPLIPLRI